VNCIVSSGNGKWFANADVVAAMLFLTKKEIPCVPEEAHRIYFGLTYTKLENWTNDEIKDMAASILLRHSDRQDLIDFRNYTPQQIATLTSMNIVLNALFYDVEWLPEIRTKLCRATDLFKVFRGMKTAQDEIYYLKDKNDVDGPYIGKIFKSARNTKYLITEADTDAFVCNQSLESLNAMGHQKTLEWISRYKGHLNQSLQNKETFWNNLANGCLQGSKDVRLFTSMNPEKRIFYGLLREPAKINQRAIGFLPLRNHLNIELCHALLNTVIGVFYVEATGFPKGLGALDNRAENTERIFMLNPQQLSPTQENQILESFKPLLERKIMDTAEEYLQADRLAFERVVAEIFGYSEYFERIKNTVLTMQKVRLSVK
jgi:hypothetical protein